MNIKQAIKTLMSHKNLNANDMLNIMNDIMTGETTDAQIAGFSIALAMKGETIDEIVSAVKVMRKLSAKLDVVDKNNLIDTCGTGGDNTNTFNISTASAIVAAAAGAKVAKHGNRSVSSKSGSADILELAGVKIDAPLDTVNKCINDINIGFMFAPVYHSAMKYAITARRDMGVKTVFNILGPLTNPAGAKKQVLGVFDRDLINPIANVLNELGSEHVLVVHSADKMDEISIADKTYIAELKNGKITEYQIEPEQFNINKSAINEIKCSSVHQSLDMIKAAFNGENGAHKDIIALNAGAAIYVSGIENNLNTGITRAMDILNSKKALAKLRELIKMSHS